MEYFPIFLLLVVVFGVAARIPFVRRSAALSTATMVALVATLTAYFALPPNGLRITWPIVALAWVSLLWKLAVDATWVEYCEVRARSALYDRPLPERERMLMLPYNVVPTLLGGVAVPLWIWLFMQDMASIAASGGFDLGPTYRLAPLVGMLSSAFMVCLMASIVFAMRKRNPWLRFQLRLTRAALAVGGARDRFVRSAVDAEPDAASPESLST